MIGGWSFFCLKGLRWERDLDLDLEGQGHGVKVKFAETCENVCKHVSNMPGACLRLLELWAPFWHKWAIIGSSFVFHQKWVKIIWNGPRSLFEVLSNQFSYKTLSKRVIASKPQNSLRIVESTSKTDRSTPNEPNVHIPVNQPKQSTLLNETPRETSRKHVFTSKLKTALCIIESTSKTNWTTPNEPNARILTNKPKQSNLLNETTRKTSRKHVFTSKPKTALRIIESTPKTHRSTLNESNFDKHRFLRKNCPNSHVVKVCALVPKNLAN